MGAEAGIPPNATPDRELPMRPMSMVPPVAASSEPMPMPESLSDTSSWEAASLAESAPSPSDPVRTEAGRTDVDRVEAGRSESLAEARHWPRSHPLHSHEPIKPSGTMNLSTPKELPAATDRLSAEHPAKSTLTEEEPPTHERIPAVASGSSKVEATPAAIGNRLGRSRGPDIRDLIGQRLAHFELLDCVGIGGMGQVFRARDTQLERLVALKVLSPDLANDPEISRRFEQEAKAAARLDHPGFARVHFYGEDRGIQFIAMEFVDGSNLRQLIDRAGQLKLPMVLPIAVALARALTYAARLGVVHRDIKPSNIIIGLDGQPKFVDMGLARDFRQRSLAQTEYTQAGVTLGTFDYISPEQAGDPRDVDVRSDLYSLGCTLFHALTGRPPFNADNPLQKLMQHKSERPPDPRQFAPDLPESMVAVLRKLLAKEPRQRFQTPEDLIQALLPIGSELGLILAGTPEEWQPRMGVIPFWERQLAWFGPTFCLLLLLIGFALQQSWQSPISAVPVLPTESALVITKTTKGPTASTIPILARDEESLRQWLPQLADQDMTIELPAAHYQLTPERQADQRWVGLSLAAENTKRLTLVGTNPNGPTVLSLKPTGLPTSAEVALLQVLGGGLTLRNIILELPVTFASHPTVCLLRIVQGRVDLERISLCFSGTRPKNEPMLPGPWQSADGINSGLGRRTNNRTSASPTLTLIQVEPRFGKCELNLNQCFLHQADVGLAMSSGTTVKAHDLAVSQCGIGFRIRADEFETGAAARLELEHATVRADGATVFLIEGTSPVKEMEWPSLNVQYCHFFTHQLAQQADQLLTQRVSSGNKANEPMFRWAGEKNAYVGFASLPMGIRESTTAPNNSYRQLSVWPKPEKEAKLIWELASLNRYLQEQWRFLELPTDLPLQDLRTLSQVGQLLGPWESGAPTTIPKPERPTLPGMAPLFEEFKSLNQIWQPPNKVQLAADYEESGSQTISLSANQHLTIRATPGNRWRLRFVARLEEPLAHRLFYLAANASLTLEDLDLEVALEAERRPDAEEQTNAPLVLFACEPGAQLTLKNVRLRFGRNNSRCAVVQLLPSLDSSTPRATERLTTRLQVKNCELRSMAPLLRTPLAHDWKLQIQETTGLLQQQLIIVEPENNERNWDGHSRQFVSEHNFFILADGLALAAEMVLPSQLQSGNTALPPATLMQTEKMLFTFKLNQSLFWWPTNTALITLENGFPRDAISWDIDSNGKKSSYFLGNKMLEYVPENSMSDSVMASITISDWLAELEEHRAQPVLVREVSSRPSFPDNLPFQFNLPYSPLSTNEDFTLPLLPDQD